MSAARSSFELSPSEDWIFGVKMRGTSLSFGPSGSAVAGASLASVAAAGVGTIVAFHSTTESTVNGYPIKHPAAMMVIGVLAALYAAAFLVSSMLVGVRADADGVLVRHLWRRRRLPWSSISAIRAHETTPHRWGLISSPDSIKLHMRPVASWSVGVVELVDGTKLRLPGFEAASRDDGLSLGLPTATELKVQALDRYMSHTTGRPPRLSTESPTRIEDEARSPSAMVRYIASCLALWLLVSWAVGVLVNPLFLIVGIAASLHRFVQRRRLR